MTPARNGAPEILSVDTQTDQRLFKRVFTNGRSQRSVDIQQGRTDATSDETKGKERSKQGLTLSHSRVGGGSLSQRSHEAKHEKQGRTGKMKTSPSTWGEVAG